MPSGHSDDVRKEQTQSGRSVDADANGDIKKKKRKQHKITGQIFCVVLYNAFRSRLLGRRRPPPAHPDRF